jgi:type I restriction-modification system DNA methylase subunit
LFEDFITLASCAIRQGVSKLLTDKLDPKTEEEYMQAVGNYTPDRAQAFSAAMAVLTNGLEAKTHDFLGSVYSAACINNEWHGQFFTPWTLCQCMAKMAIHDAKPDPKHRFTVGEPAVGGGAMLMAVAEELRRAGFSPRHWYFVGTDIDRRCCQMAYIQLSLVGAAGIVRHGNSLSNEIWGTWLTPMGALFPHVWPKAKIIPLPNQATLDLIQPLAA